MQRTAGRAGQGGARAAPRPLMPRTITMGLLFAAGDYAGWSSYGANARYVVVLVLVAAVMTDYARTVPADPRSVLLTLPGYLFVAWLWILVIRALSMGTWETSTTVLIVPPSLVLTVSLLIGSRWPARPAKDPPWVIYAPYAAAVVFSGLSLLDAWNAPFGQPLTLLNHEKSFIAVYILLMPRAPGSLPVKLLTIAALGLSLYKYPAATTLIAFLLALGTLVLLRAFRNPAPLALAALSGLIMLGITGVLEEGLDSFYNAIGRGANNETRFTLWNQAWSHFLRNPLAGGAMEARITGTGQIEGILTLLPFHNSYLTIMTAGGAVALTLFSALNAVVFSAALRKPLTFRSQYVAQWLPAAVAALTSMTVNPILDKLESAVFFYVLLVVGLVNLSRVSQEWIAHYSNPKDSFEPASESFRGNTVWPGKTPK